MPNINDLKDSKYLTKEDADPAITVTIAGYDYVDVSLESQPTKMKYILRFNEVGKPLVLNNTNGQRIAVITGREDFDDWIGVKITLFNDKMVSFGGKAVGGIRVYVPQPDLSNNQVSSEPSVADADIPQQRTVATPDNIAARADAARAAHVANNPKATVDNNIPF